MMTSKYHNADVENKDDCWLVCESGSAWQRQQDTAEQRTLQDSQIPKDGRTCFGHRLAKEVRSIRSHEKVAYFAKFKYSQVI